MSHEYDFRQKTVLHEPHCCMKRDRVKPGDCRVTNRFSVILKDDPSRLMRYIGRDLCTFFADCCGLSVRLRFVRNPEAYAGKPNTVVLLRAADTATLPAFEAEKKGAYHILVRADHIVVTGAEERGLGQGVYRLEDEMKLTGAPALAVRDKAYTPLFSPRMTHSGFELDTFPDLFLELAAHAGMDAIIVYAGHPDSNLHGFPDPDALWPDSNRGICDYQDLVYRAAGFGLDVYIYSHIKCDMHPREEGARAYYEASFGALMRRCPGIAGWIFVGETFEFPSLDPHTCGKRVQLRDDPEDTRLNVGWYPCFDYPELVTMVRDVIRGYNPACDIVFWTYNWGYVDREARLSLIHSLPRDVSLLVTFDMWETFRSEDGAPYRIDDYSISFAGPSSVYTDEAEAAAACGLRLYTMANTGGRTWDCGVTPYLPVPQQWMKRYAALRASHGAHGLSGIMEDHHYGWMPSFLTLLEKNAFVAGGESDAEMLRAIAARDYGDGAADAIAAWELFSMGMQRVVASGVDQYGPYRCGCAYPLLFDQDASTLHYPAPEWAWHPGGGIWNADYPDTVLEDPAFSCMRLQRVQQVTETFEKALHLLQQAARARGADRAETGRQCAVAGMLEATYRTAMHVMLWNIAKRLLLARAADPAFVAPPACVRALAPVLEAENDVTVASLAAAMHRVARLETENTRRAVNCWRRDSLIGYEPSLEYAFSDACARYKNSITTASQRRLDRFVSRL